jgi:multiple sugar transport system permease protein
MRAIAGIRAWGWAWPAVLIVSVLVAWPLGVVVWQSLLRTSPAVPGRTEFVALGNYGTVLTSAVWWSALLTTGLFTLLVVAVQLLLGVLFAASLRALPFSWPVARLVVLVPAVTLSVAAAASMEVAVQSGFLHTWLRLEGTSDLASLIAVGLAEVWRGTGFVVVIVYLAMARVSEEFLEVAILAGVGPWRRWTWVWWPAVSRAVGVAVVFRCLDTLRIVVGPVLRDGPTVTHRPWTAVLWNDAFGGFEQGLASAEAVIALVLIGVIGLLLVWVLRLRRAA